MEARHSSYYRHFLIGKGVNGGGSSCRGYYTGRYMATQTCSLYYVRYTTISDSVQQQQQNTLYQVLQYRSCSSYHALQLQYSHCTM